MIARGKMKKSRHANVLSRVQEPKARSPGISDVGTEARVLLRLKAKLQKGRRQAGPVRE